jgi:hypothetical protein
MPAAEVGGVMVVRNTTMLVATSDSTGCRRLLRAHLVPSGVVLLCAI